MVPEPIVEQLALFLLRESHQYPGPEEPIILVTWLFRKLPVPVVPNRVFRPRGLDDQNNFLIRILFRVLFELNLSDQILSYPEILS